MVGALACTMRCSFLQPVIILVGAHVRLLRCMEWNAGGLSTTVSVPHVYPLKLLLRWPETRGGQRLTRRN